MAASTEPVTTSAVQPMTGAEYLESIRDGREIWIYGERVEDVTTHPAFRNPARMVARLYDALHDPERRDVLTTRDRHGRRDFTHPFFRTAASAEDVRRRRDAIAEWARISYGWMGRSPDYKAAFLGTLGANADFYDPYQDNARRWYQRRAGARPVLQPRHRQPADRPPQARPTRSPTSTSTSSRRPTTASSSAARRWWRPARR